MTDTTKRDAVADTPSVYTQLSHPLHIGLQRICGPINWLQDMALTAHNRYGAKYFAIEHLHGGVQLRFTQDDPRDTP